MGLLQPWRLLAVLILLMSVLGTDRVINFGRSLGGSVRNLRNAVQSDTSGNLGSEFGKSPSTYPSHQPYQTPYTGSSTPSHSTRTERSGPTTPEAGVI